MCFFTLQTCKTLILAVYETDVICSEMIQCDPIDNKTTTCMHFFFRHLLNFVLAL